MLQVKPRSVEVPTVSPTPDDSQCGTPGKQPNLVRVLVRHVADDHDEVQQMLDGVGVPPHQLVLLVTGKSDVFELMLQQRHLRK